MQQEPWLTNSPQVMWNCFLQKRGILSFHKLSVFLEAEVRRDTRIYAKVREWYLSGTGLDSYIISDLQQNTFYSTQERLFRNKQNEILF